jgi:hypothetical protein
MKFSEFLNEDSNRYSININYRTALPEVLEGYAKLTLGYVSAALKSAGFHIKQVFDEKPQRIIIATRHFDDGEWAGILSYHAGTGKFVISKGLYNRGNKSVAVHGTKAITGTSASEIAKEVVPFMRNLEKEPAKLPMLNPPKQKTGPKS